MIILSNILVMSHILQRPYQYSFYLYGKLRTTISYYFPYYLRSSISKIYPNIYIGNLSSIVDRESLQDEGITHILSAVSGVFPLYPSDFNYLNLELHDENNFNIKAFFEESNKFL